MWSTAFSAVAAAAGNVATVMTLLQRLDTLSLALVEELREGIRVQGSGLEPLAVEIRRAQAEVQAGLSKRCGAGAAGRGSDEAQALPGRRRGAMQRGPPQRRSCERCRAESARRAGPGRRAAGGRGRRPGGASRAAVAEARGAAGGGGAEGAEAMLEVALSCMRSGFFQFERLHDAWDAAEPREDGGTAVEQEAGPEDSVLHSTCLDVRSTGLGDAKSGVTWECGNLTRHCRRGRYAGPLGALCPVSCGTCRRPCQDVSFTTFTEDDGRHSSCADLKHLCNDGELRGRVVRLCPVTCGICVGLVEGPAGVPYRSLRNHTRALESALEARAGRARGPSRVPELPAAASRRGSEGELWRIPRILHQTWKTDAMPAKHAEQLASWRRFHPHWHFEFWDDHRSRALLGRHFPGYATAFNEMSGIKRADVARIAALHEFGGVYADIDVEASRSFDELLDAAADVHAGVLLGEENAVHAVLLERRLTVRLVSNAVMASAPGHPFWLEVLDAIFKQSRHCGADPVLCTGPRLLDRLSFAHLRAHPACGSRGCIVRLPYQYFSPHIARWNAHNMESSCRQLMESAGSARQARVALSACQKFERAVRYPAALRSSRTFAVHHWQCSWCREDPTSFQTVPLHEMIWRVGNESSGFPER